MDVIINQDNSRRMVTVQQKSMVSEVLLPSGLARRRLYGHRDLSEEDGEACDRWEMRAELEMFITDIAAAKWAAAEAAEQAAAEEPRGEGGDEKKPGPPRRRFRKPDYMDDDDGPEGFPEPHPQERPGRAARLGLVQLRR